MLTEFVPLRQTDEGRRRLFNDRDFELYIWYDKQGTRIVGFQLVYGNERKFAFSFTEEEGFTHMEVDGWDNTMYQGTPLLVMDGAFDYQRVVPLVTAVMSQIDSEVKEYVVTRFELYYRL